MNVPAVLSSAFFILSSLWVFYDASNRKIGESPEFAKELNISPFWWAMWCLLLWIVGFPYYLMKRGKLIERAKVVPVENRNFGGQMGLLCLISAAIVWLLLLMNPLLLGLPACDSTEVKTLAEQILQKNPVIKLLGTDGILMTPGEVDSKSSTDKRECRAILTTNLGQQPVYYSVEWQKKSEGLVWVQFNDGARM